ncbi:MAG: MG2 domain-containing protein [Candidatus Helarchaeota archaeon]
MSDNELNLFFKLHDKNENIFELITKNGGPIISRILHDISTWKDSPQIFVQYNKNLSFNQNLRARLLILDSNFKPISNAKITLQILKDNNIYETIHVVNTDSKGICLINLKIDYFNDKDDKQSKQLMIFVESGEQSTSFPLTFNQANKGSYGIYIFLDRFIYKPGQHILAKIIAWQHINGIFMINQNEPLKISLLNQVLGKLFVKKLELDEYGTCNIEFPISKELDEGKYFIQAEIGNSKKRIEIKIDHFKRPVIDLDLKVSPNYLLINSSIEININAKYFWDEFVANGDIYITLQDSDNKLISYLKGQTDIYGNWNGTLNIPPSININEGILKVNIHDKFDRNSFKELKMPFALKPFGIIFPKPILNSGLNNKIILKLYRPDNSFIDGCNAFAALRFNNTTFFAHTTSDKYGKAIFSIDLPPIDAPLKTKIIYEFIIGNDRETIIKDITILPYIKSDTDKDSYKSNISLELDKKEVQVGESITLKIDSYTGSPTLLLIKKDDILKYDEIFPKSTTTYYQLEIDRNYWGDIYVELYSFNHDGDLEKISDSFKVLLDNKSLNISITTNKKTYQPGDIADFEIDVFQDSQTVPANLCIAFVDSSILALGGTHKDPIQCLFSEKFSDKEIVTYYSWDRSLFIDNIGELLELLNYLAYLDREAILSIIYLVLNIEKQKLLNQSTIQTCLYKLINAIIRHSDNNTPLWILYSDYHSFSKNLINDLFDYIFLKWMKSNNEISNISLILHELINRKNNQIITEESFLSTYYRITSILVKNYPNLKVFYSLLNFNTDFIKKIDPELANKVENLILTDVEKNPLKKFLTPEELEKSAIIFRFGSRFLITGYEGMNQPMDASWCVVGYPKYSSVMTDVDHYSQESYEGESVDENLGLIIMDPPKSDSSITTDSDDLNLISQEIPIIGKIRKWFPETAFWSPNLLYRGKSPYELSITMPDTIGKHELIVIGSTKDCEIGMSNIDCLISQDFFIKLNLPKKVFLGEEIIFSTLITNQYDVDLDCTIELDSNQMEIYSTLNQSNKINIEIPKNSTKSLKWKGIPLRVGKFILKMLASSSKYIDTVEFPIEIFPPGYPIIESYSTQVSNNLIGQFRFNYDHNCVDRSVSLSILLNGLSGILQSVDRLIQYSHACNEQVSSAIISSALVIQYLIKNNKFDTSIIKDAEHKISSGIQILLSRKNSNNTWHWYNDEKTDLLISIQVLEALLEASKIGFEFENNDLIPSFKSILSKLTSLIIRPISNNFPISIIAKFFYLIKDIINDSSIDELYSFLLDNVSRISDPYDLANVCFVLASMGTDVSTHLQWLKSQAINDDNLTYWKSRSTLTGNIGATSAVIRLLSLTKFDNSLLIRSKNWLLNQWDGSLGFGSTAKNLEAIKALLSIPEVISNFEITIKINDTLFKQFIITPDDFEDKIIPLKNIILPKLTQDSLISISISSDLKDFCSIVNLIDKKWYSQTYEFAKKSPSLSINKNFDKKFANLNEPITCTLEFSAREKFSIIVIEDPLPSGFILDLDSLQIDSFNYEILDNKIKFFLTEFNGNSTISYKLIPTLSGKIFSPGAIAYSMYDERNIVSWTIPFLLNIKEV